MLDPLPMLIAAAATIPIGYVWYSPMLFANHWLALNGLNPKKLQKQSMIPPLVTSIGTSLVMAFLLSLLIRQLYITDLRNAWQLGLLLWFGFDFMPNLTRALFSRKPLELVLIDTGHQASNVVVMSWILMMWQ